MRYNILIHRHDNFDPAQSCIVLQKIRFGQFYLDGYITTGENFENQGEFVL